MSAMKLIQNHVKTYGVKTNPLKVGKNTVQRPKKELVKR